MSILDTLVHFIQKNEHNPNRGPLPYLFHHSIHYTRFLIEDKLKIILTLEQVKRLMYEEGLLDDSEYFPQWYIDKWS